MTVSHELSSPLTLVRSLRRHRATLTGDQIDGRLIQIEQSLQRMLEVADVAEVTGESPMTIYQAIRRGQLPVHRDGVTNRIRVTMEDAVARKNRLRRRQVRPAPAGLVETGRMPSTSSAPSGKLPQHHED